MAKKKGFVFNWNCPALVIQLIGCFLLGVAIFLPYWLSNPPGLNYYPYSRNWGLIWVSGRVNKTHWQTWNTACQGYAQMSHGLMCISPLCNWYSGKCGGYRVVLVVSSTICALLCLAEVLVLGSFLCSLRKSTQSLRISTGTSFIATLVTFGAIMAYVFGMNQAFEIVNSGGHYPVPQPGISFILACVATFLFLIGTILHCTRYRAFKRETDYIEDMKYAHDEAQRSLGIGAS